MTIITNLPQLSLFECIFCVPFLSLLNITATHTSESDMIELLVKRSNCNLSVLDEDRNSLVHHLVLTSQEHQLDNLIQLPTLTGLINEQNVLGATPLAIAVTSDNKERVELLLTHGADPKLCLQI